MKKKLYKDHVVSYLQHECRRVESGQQAGSDTCRFVLYYHVGFEVLPEEEVPGTDRCSDDDMGVAQTCAIGPSRTSLRTCALLSGYISGFNATLLIKSDSEGYRSSLFWCL